VFPLVLEAGGTFRPNKLSCLSAETFPSFNHFLVNCETANQQNPARGNRSQTVMNEDTSPGYGFYPRTEQ